MKPRHILTLLLFIFFACQAKAQVTDKVKSQSNSNSSQSGSSHSYSGSSSSDDAAAGCVGDLIGGCITGCFTSVLPDAINGIIEMQRYAMSNYDSIHRMLSIELEPMVAVHPFFIHDDKPYNFYVPRARLNWGIFSTDFRMHELAEGDSIQKNFRTWDWQMIELNIANKPNWRLSFGSGVAKEVYSQTWFPEYTLNADVYINDQPHDQRWRLNGETRFMYDFGTGRTPRLEWSLQSGYAVVQSPEFHLYLTFGALDDWYYTGVNTWAVSGGVYFRID